MRFKPFCITLCLFLSIFISVALLHPYESAKRSPYREGEIILSYQRGLDFGRVEEIAKERGTKIVYRSYHANFVTVKIGDGEDLWNTIEEFETYEEINFAEPNAVVKIFWTPNDPYFQYQWNFDASHINMPLAWDIERGGNSSVIVAILDTGVAYKTNLIPSYEQSEVSSSDGYYHISPDLMSTNFVGGYDFINSDTLPNDEHGHGTHVSGTVAQSTDNAKGVAGMAFNVSIMPVRVLDHEGYGGTDVIADGIAFAYQNGADVISMSLGGGAGDSTGFGIVHQEIINATNAGVLVVAAAGNDGTGQLSYPAAYDECIAVGATDIDNTRATYSQWGTGIDIVAPGGDLNDTIPGTNYLAGVLQSTYWFMNDGWTQLASVDSFGYTFLQGTSMATPHVSGLAALLIAHGITTPSAIKSTIYSTATDLGATGYDTYYGNGLINPPVALGAELLFTSMPILQNPYSQQYIDIWVVPRTPIMNDLPDTCRVTLGGSTSYLSFSKIAAQTYKTDFFFDESGTASIYVSARDTAGTRGTFSKTFTVSKVYGTSGGSAVSEDGQFRITIPKSSDGRVYWIVISKEDPGIDEIPYSPISSLYQCGPQGKEIYTPSIVRFSFQKDIVNTVAVEDIGIYRKDGDILTYIDTKIDSENGFAYGSVSEFGSYLLVHWPGHGKSRIIDVSQLSLKCYPVPVTERIFYDYLIPLGSYVDIALYDVSGRRVKQIVRNEYRYSGMYSGSLELEKSISSGVYFLRIVTAHEDGVIENSRKFILMR
jgi:serine protease